MPRISQIALIVQIRYAMPYNLYEAPRFGIFRISTDHYTMANGWSNKLEKAKIIGEDEDTYITELLPEDDGTMLPLGIHRSRLERWTDGQLELEF